MCGACLFPPPKRLLHRAKRYAESVEKRIAEFDPRAKALEKWQRQVNRAKSNDKPKSEWPEKPEDAENLRYRRAGLSGAPRR
ncbi:MAG: hypothetical protein R6V56_01290 [Lentisphaeria bacterium]